MKITQLLPDIWRLEVPFEDIYTAVFVLRTRQGCLLIDSATTDEDVEIHILPALASLGLSTSPRALLLTHGHGDHAGGARRLAQAFPEMQILAHEEVGELPLRRIEDNELLCGRLRVLHLPGHTRHCVGFLDEKTNSLFSGDCLQLHGVGRYRNGIGHPTLYKESLQRLSQLAPYRIFASHEYDPLGSVAQGHAAVEHYLAECASALSVAHIPRNGMKF